MTQAQTDQPARPQDAPAEPKLVPVGESIKYRRRAQQAESKTTELQQQLDDLKGQLEHRNEELAVAEADPELFQARRTTG